MSSAPLIVPQTFHGVQMLRGLAACSVVLGHAVSMGSNMGMGIDKTFAYTALYILQGGVDVFFVISGFIIAWTAKEIGIEHGRFGACIFVAKRIVRIYPVYWTVFALTALFWLLTGHGRELSDLTMATILLTTTNPVLVPQAWTLYFEVTFYALVAVVLLLSPSNATTTLLIVVCAIAISDFLPSIKAPGVLSNVLTLEFGFGVVIASLARRGINGPWLPCLLLAGAFFAAGSFLSIGPTLISELTRVATFGLGSALLVYAIIAAEIAGATFSAALLYLGAMSYSLYVLHVLTLSVMARYAKKGPLILVPGWIQVATWFPLAVLSAAVFYQIIEKPLLKLLKVPRPARRAAAC